MAGDDAQERTHEPTEKRKKKFRDEGQVPRSKEVTATVGLAVGAAVLGACSGRIGTGMREVFATCYTSIPEGDIDLAALMSLAQEMFASFWFMMAIPMALFWVSAALVEGIQGRGTLPKEPLKFDIEKLDPFKGFKKMFLSPKPLVEMAKGLMKLLLIGWMVWTGMEDQIGMLPELTNGTVMQLLEGHYAVAMLVVQRAMPVAIMIAILDYAYQWYEMQEELMMTRDEVKEEHREMEGDPHVRAARRQRAREIANAQAVRDVAQADVVVTNPTHYAVALRYRTNEAPAPIVIARGVDHLALKIRAAARQHDIPTVENRTLARALYAKGRVGAMIPEALYGAVAQVLAIIYRRRRRRSRPISQQPASRPAQ